MPKDGRALAACYSARRAFHAGDAVRICPPAGRQGTNGSLLDIQDFALTLAAVFDIRELTQHLASKHILALSTRPSEARPVSVQRLRHQGCRSTAKFARYEDGRRICRTGKAAADLSVTA
jgi:hypothetical protein